MERTDRDRLLLAGTFLELDERAPKAKTAIEAFLSGFPSSSLVTENRTPLFGTIRFSSLVPEHDADARSATRWSVQAEPTRLAIGGPGTPSTHPRWLAPQSRADPQRLDRDLSQSSPTTPLDTPAPRSADERCLCCPKPRTQRSGRSRVGERNQRRQCLSRAQRSMAAPYSRSSTPHPRRNAPRVRRSSRLTRPCWPWCRTWQ